MIVEWVEGETAPRDFDLTVDDAPFDLTGYTVELVVKDKAGAAVDMAGDVSIPTPSAGRVRVTPDAADMTLAKSMLSARFKLTDGGGGIGYFPRGEPMTWKVFAP